MLISLLNIVLFTILGATVNGAAASPLKQPFLIRIDNTTHIIGNDIWNVTIVRSQGRKLYYKNTELVGNSPGHYVSFSA
jgi:rhamnogalacturonan endolyase